MKRIRAYLNDRGLRLLRRVNRLLGFILEPTENIGLDVAAIASNVMWSTLLRLPASAPYPDIFISSNAL